MIGGAISDFIYYCLCDDCCLFVCSVVCEGMRGDVGARMTPLFSSFAA